MRRKVCTKRGLYRGRVIWDYASFDLAAFLDDDDIADYMLVSDTDTPERITFDALFKERYAKPLTVIVNCG